MTKRHVDPELKERIKEIKKDLAEKGIDFDGLGEEIEKLGSEGPDFGPRNEIEYRRLIKEIRESGKDDD